MNTKTNRIAWIDAIKGATILAVVAGHCLDGYLKAGMFPAQTKTLYEIWYFIYAYHMPLFFVISGYTFCLAYLSQDGRSLKRSRFLLQLINLACMYSIWVIMLWVMKFFLAEYVNTTYTLRDLLDMFVNPLGNYWYLYVLTILYILTAAGKLYRIRAEVYLPVLAVICVGAGMIQEHLPFTLYRVLYHLFFFALGVALCRHPTVLNKNMVFGTSLLVSALCWGLHYAAEWDLQGSFLLRPLTATGMSLVFLFLFQKAKKLELRFLRLCGSYCLQIYLVHPYLTAANRSLLPALGIHGAFVSLLVNAASALLISLGIALVAEKVPISDIFFKPSVYFQKYLEPKAHSQS